MVENTEESRRAKENQVLFSTDEEVRISNLLSIDLEQMRARYITKGMAKKSQKEQWNILGRVIYQRRDF